MGAHEVTQQQFAKVMTRLSQKRPSFFDEDRGGGPDHPVENVPWIHAVQFCKSLSQLPEEKRAGRTYRLPTEAEWEYACRAGTTTAFHFGDTLTSRQANFDGAYPYGKAGKGPYLAKTARVGSYPPNAWGLYDMHGNVGEWCADWYDPNYYRSSPRDDPPGPAKGVVATSYPKEFYLVVRGGSWFDEGRGCRSAYRFRQAPGNPNRSRLVGFRVVCQVAAALPGKASGHLEGERGGALERALSRAGPR
jgi:formylglycine-generating enzyme required for sulfatase activity